MSLSLSFREENKSLERRGRQMEILVEEKLHFPLISSILFYPSDAQSDCSKRMSEFTLKCSYMFRFNNHHQGATIRALLKL